MAASPSTEICRRSTEKRAHLTAADTIKRGKKPFPSGCVLNAARLSATIRHCLQLQSVTQTSCATSFPAGGVGFHRPDRLRRMFRRLWRRQAFRRLSTSGYDPGRDLSFFIRALSVPSRFRLFPRRHSSRRTSRWLSEPRTISIAPWSSVRYLRGVVPVTLRKSREK